MADPVVPQSTFAQGNSFQELLNQMLLDVPADFDKAEGSFVYDLLAATALALEPTYLTMDAVMNQAFLQTATGTYLDARADELGLTRKAATAATVTVTFTGTEGTLVPAGTRVTNVVPAGTSGTPVSFETTAAATIASGSASAPALATTAGANGNVVAGSIARLETGIAGVFTVTNATAAQGGAEVEDDATLRDRALARARTGRGPGTPGDYAAWARSVVGVGQAVVEPLWNGNGTVRVVVMDDAYAPVSADVLAAVTSTIAANAPIGAAVTVITPVTVSINVSATLALDAGYTAAAVLPAVQLALTSYLRTVRPGGTVYLNKVGAAIDQVPGVLDYSSLQIGAPSLGGANLTLSSGQKPILGTVTLS
jgi:uncharacterized phage protein gp47/JayE